MSIVNNHNKFQKEVMDLLKNKKYIGIPSGKSTFDEYIVNSDTKKKLIILGMLDFKIEKKRIKISGRRDKRVNVSKSQAESLTFWGKRVIFIIKTKDPSDKYIIIKEKAFLVLSKS